MELSSPKKAQSAIEFITLIGAMLFFFIILAHAFQQNIAEKRIQEQRLLTQEIARTVQSEIDLAANSVNGYSRTFTLPQKILNLNYTITLQENLVILQTPEPGIASTLPIKNITGQIQKGENTIRKTDGQVFLN